MDSRVSEQDQGCRGAEGHECILAGSGLAGKGSGPAEKILNSLKFGLSPEAKTIVLLGKARMKAKWTLGFSMLSLVAGAQLFSLRADCAELGEIVRNANGSVRPMTQYHAEIYCKEHGTRLPTAREFAVYSQRLGARGIRETAYPGVAYSNAAVQAEISQMDGSGYGPIYVYVPRSGQSAVDFYYAYGGYQRPAGDLGSHWFWSSSIYPDNPDLAYGLVGDFGYFFWGNRSNTSSLVRCVL